MTCTRCACQTPRLTLSQRHCPLCRREVERLMAADAKRHIVRFQRIRDFTGVAA